MIDDNGQWSPDIYPKQREGLEACLPNSRNMVLFNGPRWAAKTFGCHHIVCNHAWNTNNGNICILTVTQSVGVDSGVWQHLTEIFMPEWIGGTLEDGTEFGGRFGMRWIRPPFIHGTTKKPTCWVSNKYGNRCVIALESLKNEDEVEDRFKGKSYSMIWVNELSKFKKYKTFNTLKQCLRMPHLAPNEHLFLADTNPDLDLGTESWIYKLWYLMANADAEDISEIYPDLDPVVLMPLQKCLRVVEFTIDDNLSLTPEKKSQIMADFAHDPDLLAAYYYGKWVTASSDALFAKVFRPGIHVCGKLATPVEPDPEILIPDPNCSELITSWDPGSATNSAAVIGERTYRMERVRIAGKDVTRKVIVIKFLDELVYVNRHHSLEEFTIDFMKLMQFWEEYLGKTARLRWRHWSDRSVFDMLSPESKRYYHEIIYEASVRAIEEGMAVISAPILLQAAERQPGSVVQRIDLWTRMLYEDRLYFSADRCPKLINAVKSLKPGPTPSQHVQRGSPHKHAWDAGSYLVSSECYDEIRREASLAMGRRNHPAKLISVAI